MIEVERNLVFLLLGLAFVTGFILGWAVFEIMQVKRLMAESQRRQEAICAAEGLPQLKVGDGVAPWKTLPSVLDKTRAIATRPKWNLGDEDELLKIGIDPTRTHDPRKHGIK